MQNNSEKRATFDNDSQNGEDDEFQPKAKRNDWRSKSPQLEKVTKVSSRGRKIKRKIICIFCNKNRSETS